MRNSLFIIVVALVAASAEGTLFAADGFDLNGSSGLFTPYQQLSNQESVNLTNGNMTRQWTEAVVPGRAGMDLYLRSTLTAGKTENIIEKFTQLYQGATTGDPDQWITWIRYKDTDIKIPSLGIIQVTSSDKFENKVAYNPQKNGWDVSWALYRGVVIFDPKGPNRDPMNARPIIFLVRPGGDLEQMENVRSTDVHSSAALMFSEDMRPYPSVVSVIGDDGRKYTFARMVEETIYHEANYARICGKWFFKHTCNDVHTNPAWHVHGYILQEVEDAYGNKIVAVNPNAGEGDTLRLEMRIRSTNENNTYFVWATLERAMLKNNETWVATHEIEQNKSSQTWVHTLDNTGRFLSSTTPSGRTTTIEYDLEKAKIAYPIVRRMGLDFLINPSSFVQIRYPSGGIVRYENFTLVDEVDQNVQHTIVTEIPDVDNTNFYFQKYYRIEKNYKDSDVQPEFIITDINTPDGARIHQEYTKEIATTWQTEKKWETTLTKQTWTANGRTVTAYYSYGSINYWSGKKSLLVKIEIERDGEEKYPHFKGTYDGAGRLTASTDALGRKIDYHYVIPHEEVMANNLEKSQVAKVMRQKNLVAQEDNSVSGKKISTIYEYGGTDTCGNSIDVTSLRKITRQVEPAAPVLQNENCFDKYGNVTREINGPTQKFAVDIAYDAHAVTKAKETDKQGHATNYVTNSLTGALTSKKQAGGVDESYEYDADGRVTKSVIGVLVTENVYTDKTKAPFGSVITTTSTDSITKSKSIVTRTFDGLGFLKSLDDNGDITTFTYDLAKRLVMVVHPDGRQESYVYDGFNRLTQEVSSGTPPQHYKYGMEKYGGIGLVDEVVTFVGNGSSPVRKIRNDLGGRQVVITGYLNEIPAETQYQMDELNSISKIQSPSDLSINEKVNYASQSMERTFPGGDKLQITKSTDFGQPEEVVLSDGVQTETTQYKYDDQFRPISVDFISTNNLDVSMSYGQKDENADGYLKEIKDGSGTSEFLYGEMGVLEGVARTIKGLKPIKIYTQKDAYGNPVWVTYPNGLTIHYIRDAKGRVTQIRRGSKTGLILASMIYNKRDLLTQVVYSSGVVTDYDYDLAGRVTRIASHEGEKYILDDRYSYDALGNKTSVTHRDGSKVVYGYDGFNRLTQAKYFKKLADTPYDVQDYGYDVDGNRTSYKDSIKEIQYVMESKDGKRISNRVASYTVSQKGKPSITVQFEYALGNLTKQTELQNGLPVLTKAFVYDPNSRLIKATIKDSRTGFETNSEYAYDYAGRRELVTVNGAKSYYGYGESLDPLVRVNAKNEIEAAYVYVGGRRLAVIEGDTLSFFHTDELGNTLKTSNDIGVVTQTVRYDPFGNINFMNGPSENRYLYAGKPRDEATGLIYFGARYYDPQLGRFLTRDPAGQGFNHYIYADNNPLIRQEVYGMSWWGDLWSWVKQIWDGVRGGGVITRQYSNPINDYSYSRNPPVNLNPRREFEDIVGGGNTSGRGRSPDLKPRAPRVERDAKPTTSDLRTKFSLNDAADFAINHNSGRAVLPTTSIVGQSGLGTSNGLATANWYEHFKGVYVTNTETLRNDISFFVNYTNVASLQNSAQKIVSVQIAQYVADQVKQRIPSGGTAGLPNNVDNYIPASEANVSSGNLIDKTDKPLSTVQEGQAQNNTKAGTNAAGDPVLLHSGDLLQSEVDLKIPGRGMEYEFRRTYRSRISYDGPLGANWDHNYNKRLVTQENGDIARFDGDARFDIYKRNEDGTYTTPAGRFDVLSKLPDSTFQIRDRHGVFYRYNSAGFITSITDSNNNALTFEYGDVAGASRLTKVTDTLGRAIQYQYYTSGAASGHLQKITDFAGRTVQFTIDANLDLVAVTSPSGKLVQYAYSSGFPEDQKELNHNLLQVTDAKGQLVLQNTYSLFDRVMTQRLGHLGQFRFEYHPLSVVANCEAADTIAQVAYRTTVTDRSQNQTTYDFNCQGNPLTIQKFTRGLRPADPAAYVTQYTYTIDGLPQTVTHPDGNQTQLIYADVNGLPKTVAEWSAGNLMTVRRTPDAKRGGGAPIETNYQYELLYNKPVAMTDPLGHTTRIWYDFQEGLSLTTIATMLGTDATSASKLFAPGLLGIGDVNSDGITTQVGGNVVGIDLPKAKDPDGVVQQLAMRFRYNTSGQVTRMADTAGAITDYAYQNGYLSQVVSDVGGLGISRSMTRDAVGNVTSLSDGNGKVTQFEVNALNQITKQTDPLGHFTQYSYDANNNVVQIDRQNLDEKGVVANGNPLVTTKIDYNVLNRPTLQRSEVSEGNFVVTEFQYDANENLTRVVQPEGNSLFVQYDERDLPYQVVRGYGSADASRTAYRYNGAGKPTQIQDPLSHITTITYDGFDRPILTTDALGNTQVAQYDAADQMTLVQRRGPPTLGGDASTVLWARKTVYDELGRAIGMTEGDRSSKLYYNFQNQLAKLVDPQGRVSNFVYDPVGRLLQQILPNGDKTVATYDAEGRTLTQTQHDTHATLGAQTFATQFAYDAAGHLTQRTTPDNAVWKYQYDSLGRLRVVVDPASITHSNSFDDLGRLISTTDDTTTTTYAWDDDSRLTSVTDAKDNKTAYTYDALNRRTQVQFADGSIQSVIYSAVSQPTQINLPNGFAINMAYDAGNQLLSRIVAQEGANTGKEVFGYDGLGRMISGKVLDANGATQDDLAMQFDDRGLLLQATQNAQTIKSTFTAGGDRQSLKYPGGMDLALTHDPIGRLTKVADGALGPLQTATYAGGMRPYQLTTPNGVAATLGYDAGARIKDLNWAKGATKLAQHAYSYNALSNITLDNTPSNVGDLYQYDTQGRLTQASMKVPNAPNFVGKTPAQFGAQYAYSYDAVSNWTQQVAKPANTTTSYTANALNQYTKVGVADLKYDKNGNLTQDETFTYTYNWRNLITEVRHTADKSLVAQYRYDVLGRRVAKVEGLSGDVTKFVYDGWNIIEERDNTGSVAASYIYDERNLPVAMQRSGKLYFYQYNHLGSIEFVTNKDGDVVEQYQYDPFGGVKVADGAGNALPNSQIDNPFLFAGQWRDDETGLCYMRHRYYSASLGRFTSRDPLEYVDGLNAYAYAMSNPVNFSDPLGLSTSAGGLNTGPGNPQFNGDILGYAKDVLAQQHQIAYSNWASAHNPAAKILYGFNTQFYGLANLLMPTQEDVAVTAMMGPVMGAVGYGEKRFTKVGSEIAEELGSVIKKLPDPYEGIKQASRYLQNMGVSRAERVRYLQSFEPHNMMVRKAGGSEFGIRYFSESLRSGGQYLFETFPASRSSLAIKSEWNSMLGFRQFQIRPGATVIEGRAAAQGPYLPGGQLQRFILDWRSDLINP